MNLEHFCDYLLKKNAKVAESTVQYFSRYMELFGDLDPYALYVPHKAKI